MAWWLFSTAGLSEANWNHDSTIGTPLNRPDIKCDSKRPSKFRHAISSYPLDKSLENL